MNVATRPDDTSAFWSEEPTERPGRARIRARIGGLHCSLCTGTIEKALGRQPGVDKVAVSLTHEQALVEYDPSLASPQALLQILRDIGYTIHDPNKLRPFEEEERDLIREGRRFLIATSFSLLAVALIVTPTGPVSLILPTVATVSLMAFVFLVLRAGGLALAIFGSVGLGILATAIIALNADGALTGITPWLVGGLAVALVFGVARHILMMAVQALRRGILNQHVLLEAGAFAGLTGGVIGLTGNFPDYPTGPFFAVAVMVTTYHIFSEWLSLIVKTRSSQAVRRLLDLQPDTARLLRDGREVEVQLDTIAVGDRVRIRPGERLPVDGEVVEGRSVVDQSLVTGEPMPVERQTGDAVIGGTVNGHGTLVVRVTRIGKESFLQRIISEVEDARALKPGLLHLVDRILRVYTPLVLTIALAAFLGWAFLPQIFGFVPDLQRAIFAGLSVLVMGYPCALGISAPLSIVRGAGEAAEKGILMRTGEAFQGYRLVRQIAFDKTGTLTVGKPKVMAVDAISVDRSALLALAAAAEMASEHPLGEAVVEAAFAENVPLPELAELKATPGLGVWARIDGADVLVGSPRYLLANNIDLSAHEARITELEAEGHTVIAVARGADMLGLIVLGDAIRPDAAETFASLREAGIRTILITGDNPRAAEHVANVLGIDEIHASVLPGQKAALIRELQRRGRTAMVGDGINDAPALMQADIGIAMGSGTDIAIDSADIIILSNRMSAVLEARKISALGYRKMIQNVSLAFLFNGVGVPLAATGLIFPVWAMVAMAVSVTAIFVNSLWGRPSLFIKAILSVGKQAEAPA